jgi:hypothetical protein
VLRIRIRTLTDPHTFGQLDPDPDLHWEYGSGSRRAKMNHKSEENSSFDVLDVFFSGIKSSPEACTSFMEA